MTSVATTVTTLYVPGETPIPEPRKESHEPWPSPLPSALRRRAASPQDGAVLLDKYQIVSTIGQGGMGIVVKARHLGLDEHVAIKLLKPQFVQNKDIVARFEREAKAAAKLKGEHIARVHDVGRLDGGVPYIVMEYLEGADLAAIIARFGAQRPAAAVDVMVQACLALAEAHANGIVHRDVKPANFFITSRPGEPPTLKVLDFGIATAPDDDTRDLTKPSVFIGTPAYVSPEQMRKPRDADARSDLWSMGVVLYELLEARQPFQGRSISDLYAAVARGPLPAMSPRVPPALQAVVQRCLQKEPSDRYQSAAELARDLVPHATDQVVAQALLAQCRRLSCRGSQPHTAVAGAQSTPPVVDPNWPPPMMPSVHAVSPIVLRPVGTPRTVDLRVKRRRWMPVIIGAIVAVVCLMISVRKLLGDGLVRAAPALADAARHAGAPPSPSLMPSLPLALPPPVVPTVEPPPPPPPAPPAVAPIAPVDVPAAAPQREEPKRAESKAAAPAPAKRKSKVPRRPMRDDEVTFIDDEPSETATPSAHRRARPAQEDGDF